MSQYLIIVSFKKFSSKEVLLALGFQYPKKPMLWIILCIVTGVFLSVLYNRQIEKPLFPGGFTAFALIAMLIGITEELVFRGYIYSRLKQFGILLSLLTCAFVHAVYKTALFAPFENVNLVTTFFYTFLAGIFLSYTRYASQSILPCMIFHALFDLLVYGDNVNSPWWVW